MAELDFDDLVAPAADAGAKRPEPTGVSFDEIAAPEPVGDIAMMSPAAFDAGVPEPPVAMMNTAGVDFDDIVAPEEPAEPTEAPRPTPNADAVRASLGITPAERAVADARLPSPVKAGFQEAARRGTLATRGISSGLTMGLDDLKIAERFLPEDAPAWQRIGAKVLTGEIAPWRLAADAPKAVSRFLETAAGEKVEAETTGEQLTEVGGQLVGGLVTGKALQGALAKAPLIANLASKPRTQVAAIRSTAAAIQGTLSGLAGVAEGEITPREAAMNVGQSIVGSALSAVPEGRVPNKVAQATVEIIADALVEAGFESWQGGNVVDYFTSGRAMNMIPAVVGALSPMTKGDYKARLKNLKADLDPAVKRINEVMTGKEPVPTKISLEEPSVVDATSETNLREFGRSGTKGQKAILELAKQEGIVTDKSTAKDKSTTNMVKALMEGDFGRRIRESNLAIPSDKEGIRRYIAQYLLERQTTLEARSQEQARQDAERNIKAEGGNLEAAKRIARGGGREGDTGIMETKQVLSDPEISQKFMEGDPETIELVQKITQSHYRRGTDIAREMAARRDTWESPQARRALLMEVLLGGGKKNVSPKEAAKRQAKAKKIIDSLRDEDGIDLTKMTDEDLMDGKKFMTTLATIGPKTASFRQKFMEFRRFALLSGLKTHEVNIIGNSLRGIWEFTGQRAGELMLGKLTGAGKRMRGELGRIKDESVAKIKDLDRQIAESTNPVVRKQLADAKKDVVDQRFRDERQVLESLPATAKSTIAAYNGMVNAVGRASSMAWEAMKSDQAIAKGDVKEDPGSFAAIKGKKGKLIRIPQRALNAADIFASELLRSGLTADFAVREAQAKGLTDIEQMSKYVDAQIANPKSSASQKADKESLRLTFREKPGELASWVLKQRNRSGPLGVAFELMFPFVTTPASLVKQGVRATPLGSISLINKLRQDIKTKGAKQALSSDEAIKRGSEQAIAMMMTAALAGAMNDKDEFGRPRITGSMPPDATPAERDFLFRNQPPQSIRIGDKWVSYARIEPLATSLTTIIDLLDTRRIQKEADEGVRDQAEARRAMWKAVSGPFRDKTFMKAVGEILEALSGENKGRSMMDVVNNQISSLMPNIIRSTVRAGQDVFQERRSRTKPIEGRKGDIRAQARQVATQAVPAKTPFTNNVRIDHWGEPVKRQTPIPTQEADGFSVPNFLFRLLSPAEIQSTDIATPIDMAILAWNAEAEDGDEFWPTRLSDLKVAGDKNSRMTDDEFEEYARTRGDYAKQMFGNWRPADPSNPTRADKDRIEATFSRAGQIAKKRLFGADIRDIRTEQRERRGAR